MAEFNLSARPLPLEEEWDVIVVGGGPAGCGAALAAAREGAKVLLLEAGYALGGMATLGLVCSWAPFGKPEAFTRGLAYTIMDRLRAYMPHVRKDRLDWVPIDPERLKWLLDTMMEEAGVTLRFGRMVCGVETEGDRVTALLVAGKDGLHALRAPLIVDASGDGDVAVAAGAAYDKGDPESGELQPATLCFVLTNVDTYMLKKGPTLHPTNPESLVYRLLAEGKYPAIKCNHLCYGYLGPRAVGFNAGHVWDVDNTKPTTIDEAIVEGRRIATQYRDALAEYYPSVFGGAYLAQTAPLMGIRETRRIQGDYTLTVEDYQARATFPDEIGRCDYWIDIHTAKGEIETAQSTHDNVTKRFEQYQPGESYGVPYRCLTPKGLRNVLVAGRSISCDRPMQGTIRVMPLCIVTGEAAGMAAVHALRNHDGDVHAVNTDTLREGLRAHGAFFH